MRSVGGDGATRRRHPQEGGYACGEETRARIIAAALRIFGELGYDLASTRRIAASAGVNPPALQYYFGGKEGLHRACAQYIIDAAEQTLGPALDHAARVARSGDRGDAVEALCGLFDAMIEGLVSSGADSWSRFIARGKVDGAGPAMEMLHQQIGERMRACATKLVAKATGRPCDEATRLRASMLLGQVAMISSNRQRSLVVMGWDEYDERKLALMKTVVRENTRGALAAVV